MKYIKKYSELIIFLSIVLLAYFFPLTGKDLFFANARVSLVEFLNISGGNVFSTGLLYYMTKYQFLKLLVYGLFGTGMFLLLKCIVNKKNTCIPFIALFLFFLLDKEIFAESFVNASGFMEYFIGALFIMLFYNFITKNSLDSLKWWEILVIGLVGTMVSPVVTFTIFIMSFVHILFKKDNMSYKKTVLLASEIVGLVLSVKNGVYSYNGIVYNLFSEFLPVVKGTNLIITFIFSGVIILEAFKIFKKEKNWKYIVSIVIVVSFLLTSILNISYVLYYVLFVLYLIASYFVLRNTHRNVLFRRKIDYWLFIKIVYIGLSLLFGNITSGSLFILVLLDIVIVLEIYNYLFPKDYLVYVWFIAALGMVLVNVYLYRGVSLKYVEMNRFIKEKLEDKCVDYIGVPARFKTDLVIGVIPKNREEVEWYLSYFEMEPCTMDSILYLYFNE